MIYLEQPREKEWRSFLAGDSVDASGDLIRSWQRSVTGGADWRSPKNSFHAPIVNRSEVRARQEAGEATRNHVSPLLQSVSHQLSSRSFIAVWADRDGVILDRSGGGDFLSTATQVELLEGANWCEKARGTNAIGTALSEGCEVAVLGRAHFQYPNHDLVCYATPIRNPFGETEGIFNITSHLQCAQQSAFAAVVSARQTIEQQLKFAAYKNAVSGGLASLYRVMDKHPWPAFLIEADNTIRYLNRRAKQRFSQETPPITWEQLLNHQGRSCRIELPNGGGNWHASVEVVENGNRRFSLMVFLEPITLRMTQAPPVPKSCEAFSGMHGDDPAMVEAVEMIGKLAPTNLPVLLLAETGTGKERMARALHQLSDRANKPFIPINCGALSESLAESELFGYAPGAFTGAVPGGSQGKIAAADEGTLFLDEVADLPLNAQAMLLRVLENGCYYRVGEAIERKAQVRVVAATCVPLERVMERMRPDLYYRLKGTLVQLPPLRQRSDLEKLVKGLLGDLAKNLGRDVPLLTPAFLTTLQQRNWPGNVRELKNTLHVALVLCGSDKILRCHHLPKDIQVTPALPKVSVTKGLKRDAEAEALYRALDKAKNLSEAARLMGVARSTLYRMLKRHGLTAQQFK